MGTDARTLPTTQGSIVRWSIRIGVEEHYGAALLDYDDGRPVWYLAGFDHEYTPEEFDIILMGRDWHEMTLDAGGAKQRIEYLENRLAAVLAECDNLDEAIAFRREDISTDRIRRAATLNQR